MLIAANSQPCAVQPDSCLFPSACLRNHDRESAKSGKDGIEDRSDPLGQVGEAGRGIGPASRFVVTSAVSLLPPALSPPTSPRFSPPSLPQPSPSPPDPSPLLDPPPESTPASSASS
ncbi:unnamed protein product [Coccothraustes coccothraustes]